MFTLPRCPSFRPVRPHWRKCSLHLFAFACQVPCQASFRPLPLGLKCCACSAGWTSCTHLDRWSWCFAQPILKVTAAWLLIQSSELPVPATQISHLLSSSFMFFHLLCTATSFQDHRCCFYYTETGFFRRNAFCQIRLTMFLRCLWYPGLMVRKAFCGRFTLKCWKVKRKTCTSPECTL